MYGACPGLDDESVNMESLRVVLNCFGLTAVFGRGNILRAAIPGGHQKTASYLMAHRRKTHSIIHAMLSLLEHSGSC